MNRFNPIHSIPRHLKSEKGFPFQSLLHFSPRILRRPPRKRRRTQRGGLLYVSPRMMGKRRLPRTQRGGLVFDRPPGYDIVRQLQKRYKSVDRRKRRKTHRTRF